jgi:hypothetical protein
VCEDSAFEGLLACFALYDYCMCMDIGTCGLGFGCAVEVGGEGCIEGSEACILVYDYQGGDQCHYQ